MSSPERTAPGEASPELPGASTRAVTAGDTDDSASAVDDAELLPLDRWALSRPPRPGVADAAGSAVTTLRSGGAETGWSSATTSFASRREVPKNRGSTSARFSGVITFASSVTVARLRRPSRRGSTISGYRWMGSAAVFR
jgi:hypothetical protein